MGNIDSLKKYYTSIAIFIHESKLHFKHLPIGYFVSHLSACAILLLELFSMDFILDHELSNQGFKIFNTFSQPILHRNDSLAVMFPYRIEVFKD